MIQVFKCNHKKTVSQLDCVLSKDEDKFEIDLKRNYKIINQKIYGTKRENCVFETYEELVELIPESNVLLIELSSDQNYVKILNEKNGIFWIHKYCLVLTN